MDSYIQNQREVTSVAYTNASAIAGNRRASASYYQLDQRSADNVIESEAPHIDSNGFQHRPPENGRVITRGEILNRIVPFWELFITNSGLLGYHILTSGVRHISGSKGLNILLFGACKSINYQEDVDLCSVSAVIWGLIGGAILYFVITSFIGVLIYVECRRNGYPGAFTGIWNSPFFLFGYLFSEKKRIDLLSIPNRLMGFSKWTHAHLSRLLLSIYSLIATALIANGLTKRTVDNNDYDANKQSENANFYSNIYNPFFLPYYVAIYLYIKMIISSGFQIKGLLSNDKPELVGVSYKALKKQ